MSDPVSLTDRAVIRLSGDDRHAFLQGLITQDMDRLADAPAAFAALLTPQGKILFDFFVVKGSDALLIDCRKDAAPALLKRLSLYKLRAKVALAIAEDQKIIVGAEMTSGGFVDPRNAALGWRAIASGDFSEDESYDRRRIATGVPEFGKDFSSDEMFLTDVNYDALNAVSYKKGCFIGQEVSSRMKRKGEIRRRTLIAEFDGPPPAKGASVAAGDSTLGEIMSGTDGRALAAIRLDRWEKAKAAGMPVTCEGRELRLVVPGALEAV